MTNTSLPVASARTSRSAWRKLKRCILLAATVLAVGVSAFAFGVRDHIRSIWSIRRIPNTKMYVMDYYASYNLEELAESGTDPNDVEGSLFRALLPDVLLPIANLISGHKKGDRDWHTSQHSCSSISFVADEGNVLFGRNFDWSHDPCLIVRMQGKRASVAVLDLHYLRLSESQLDNLSLKDRLNLLFAPYLVEDGMNEYGLAVSSMAVDESGVPNDDAKPTVIKPLLKRMILDFARTTEEAIEVIQRYNIDFAGTPCHLMIADRTGKSVVVEFVDGKTSILVANDPWHIATNHLLTGNTDQMNRDKCWRFNTASEAISQDKSQFDAERMMRVMSSISVPDWTMWTSVYDLNSGAYQVAYRRRYEQVFRDQLRLRGR